MVRLKSVVFDYLIMIRLKHIGTLLTIEVELTELQEYTKALDGVITLVQGLDSENKDVYTLKDLSVNLARIIGEAR